MSARKIEDANIILSDDGGTITINLEDEAADADVSTLAYPVFIDEDSREGTRKLFERHGDEL